MGAAFVLADFNFFFTKENWKSDDRLLMKAFMLTVSQRSVIMISNVNLRIQLLCLLIVTLHESGESGFTKSLLTRVTKHQTHT